MKYLIALCVIFSSQKALAQVEGFGLSLGLTNYVTDSNLVFSKSDTGFTFGAVGTVELGERLGLFVEITLSQHRMKFVGRETETSGPKDIKFKLEEASIPFILNYNYLELNDFTFGLNLGTSFHFSHNFVLIDESKESHFLDPLLVQARYMEFDTWNEDISFNTFLVMGLNVQYKYNLMGSFRYFYGISDPYRKSPVYSPYVDISGRDSFFSFSITYFIN